MLNGMVTVYLTAQESKGSLYSLDAVVIQTALIADSTQRILGQLEEDPSVLPRSDIEAMIHSVHFETDDYHRQTLLNLLLLAFKKIETHLDRGRKLEPYVQSTQSLLTETISYDVFTDLPLTPDGKITETTTLSEIIKTFLSRLAFTKKYHRESLPIKASSLQIRTWMTSPFHDSPSIDEESHLKCLSRNLLSLCAYSLQFFYLERLLIDFFRFSLTNTPYRSIFLEACLVMLSELCQENHDKTRCSR